MATYPGVISTHERSKAAKNIEDVLVDQIVRHLTDDGSAPDSAAGDPQPQDRDIVFEGTFEEVNDFFYRNQ